jgi:hypothetical protein
MQVRAPSMQPNVASRQRQVSRTEGSIGIGDGQAGCRHRDPHRLLELTRQLPNLTMGDGFAKLGCGEEKPKR